MPILGAVGSYPEAKNSGPVFARRCVQPLQKLDEMPSLMRFFVIGPLVTACLLPALAQAQSLPLSGQSCIPEFNAGNRCTSNSLAFRAISVDPSVSRCEIGETLDLRIGVTVGTGVLRAAKDRHNLSFWVGENGNLTISDTGSCTVGWQRHLRAAYPRADPLLGARAACRPDGMVGIPAAAGSISDYPLEPHSPGLLAFRHLS